jgi:hypothetical protein
MSCCKVGLAFSQPYFHVVKIMNAKKDMMYLLLALILAALLYMMISSLQKTAQTNNALQQLEFSK